MPAPGSLPSPNANHFINLCLIKWLVWNYPQLDTYPHSPGNAPLFFPSPRSFGSTQSSRRFLPILPQHSLTMFFLTFWSMFFALPEMKPKQCYKMTVPTSYCKKQALLQNDSPSKKHACYKMTWFSVTKCHFLFFQMPLKPGHGWPHFITEMGTGMYKSLIAFITRYKKLRKLCWAMLSYVELCWLMKVRLTNITQLNHHN